MIERINITEDVARSPSTREVALDGLRQGMQAAIARIFDNTASAAAVDPQNTFRKGLDRVISHYEWAWDTIQKHTEN